MCTGPSVVVAKFDFVSVTLYPAKANAPLFVYANAMLALAIFTQRLQPIAGWHTQKIQTRSAVDQVQLALRAHCDVGRNRLHELPREQRGSPLVGQSLDHPNNLVQ